MLESELKPSPASLQAPKHRANPECGPEFSYQMPGPHLTGQYRLEHPGQE